MIGCSKINVDHYTSTGTLALTPQGEMTVHCSGPLWLLYIPQHATKTLAAMTEDEYREHTQRRKNEHYLGTFSAWLNQHTPKPAGTDSLQKIASAKLDLVVCGYIFHGQKVLLIHHKKLKLWLPVGGHIEPNETPDDALRREIMEETGFLVEFLQQPDRPAEGTVRAHLATPFSVNVHSVGDHDHCCFFYVCRANNPSDLKIDPDELLDAAWFSRDDLFQDRVSKEIRLEALKAFAVVDALGT